MNTELLNRGRTHGTGAPLAWWGTAEFPGITSNTGCTATIVMDPCKSSTGGYAKPVGFDIVFEPKLARCMIIDSAMLRWLGCDRGNATIPSLAVKHALMHQYLLDASTCPPRAISFTLEGEHVSEPESASRGRSKRTESSETAAQILLAEIRATTGLTFEEIAPLMGVSRRSVQLWRAGEPISARKEVRLRNLVECLRDLAKHDPGKARQMLFDRTVDGLRPYDVLSEGQFDIAFSMLAGVAPPTDLRARAVRLNIPPAPPLLPRLSAVNDGSPGTGGRADLRRSRRLKS